MYIFYSFDGIEETWIPYSSKKCF